MPPDVWMPPATVTIGGWRITPIWRRDGPQTVCVGVTVMADPDTDRTLTGLVWDELRPIAEAVSDRRAYAVAVYRAAAAAGEPPTQAVADALGMKVTSAYNFVSRLRDDGLLPPTRPGAVVA